jgi:hypothetical protein
MHRHRIAQCLGCLGAWFTTEPWPCECDAPAMLMTVTVGGYLDDCDCTPERLLAAQSELLWQGGLKSPPDRQQPSGKSVTGGLLSA